MATRVALEADELRQNLQQALDRVVQAERGTQKAEDQVSRAWATGARGETPELIGSKWDLGCENLSASLNPLIAEWEGNGNDCINTAAPLLCFRALQGPSRPSLPSPLPYLFDD